MYWLKWFGMLNYNFWRSRKIRARTANVWALYCFVLHDNASTTPITIFESQELLSPRRSLREERSGFITLCLRWCAHHMHWTQFEHTKALHKHATCTFKHFPNTADMHLDVGLYASMRLSLCSSYTRSMPLTLPEQGQHQFKHTRSRFLASNTVLEHCHLFCCFLFIKTLKVKWILYPI